MSLKQLLRLTGGSSRGWGGEGVSEQKLGDFLDKALRFTKRRVGGLEI